MDLFPFRFEDRWLIVNDFSAKFKEWWKANEINDKPSYRLVNKLKAKKSTINE